MQRKNRSYGGECLIEEQIIKRISRDIKGRLGHAAVFGSLILECPVTYVLTGAF